LDRLLIIFIATEVAWERKYNGFATDLLLETISTYLTHAPYGYAKCSAIVNSSGTGKSRMVDELSKKIITVPMCLRGVYSQGTALFGSSQFSMLICYNIAGYPPPDDSLRDWLILGREDQLSVRLRLHAFIHSLLTVTLKHLESFDDAMSSESSPNCPLNNVDQFAIGSSFSGSDDKMERMEKLAIAFHDHMTEGQRFQNTCLYRKVFYEEVMERAKGVSFVLIT